MRETLYADVLQWSTVPGVDLEQSMDVPLSYIVDAGFDENERVAVAYNPSTDVLRFYADTADDLEYIVSASTGGERTAEPKPWTQGVDW